MIPLKAIDIVLAAMFVALMAIGANITSWVPFLQVGPVPLTMQPFFCVLAGVLLGARISMLSMLVYLLVGIIGVPVFSQFGSGFGKVIGPTGGFLISYILAAYIIGKSVEAFKKKQLSTFIIASFLGIIVIYIFGTTWMYASMNFVINTPISYLQAWDIMKYFAIKDTIVTLLAALLAPRLFTALQKAKGIAPEATIAKN